MNHIIESGKNLKYANAKQQNNQLLTHKLIINLYPKYLEKCWHITRRLTISRLEEASLFSCSSEQACESCSQPESTWTLNPYPSYSSPNAYELTQPSWWDGTGPLEFLVQDLTKMKEKKPLKNHKNQTSTFQNRDGILCKSICTITFTSQAWGIHTRETHLYVRRSLQIPIIWKNFLPETWIKWQMLHTF